MSGVKGREKARKRHGASGEPISTNCIFYVDSHVQMTLKLGIALATGWSGIDGPSAKQFYTTPNDTKNTLRTGSAPFVANSATWVDVRHTAGAPLLTAAEPPSRNSDAYVARCQQEKHDGLLGLDAS